ncbi:hypothetical protein HHK36_004573 [Tetracentron sinense]|uniref:Pentatricopeptide repeat-containing protein n=1 Tax=Tetracentron sinense TaxID=13715 RepID=A0A834ZQV2_TETSI|nr:hypothetical protein HHK36_004573 [Tetracentron sinense]
MVAVKRFFDQMPKKNEISWSTFLNGYAQNGDFKEALIIFCEMQALARIEVSLDMVYCFKNAIAKRRSN